MAGTLEGGRKAAATNKRKYGKDHYSKIGKIGGARGHTGGFFANRVLAREAGARGGRVSRRYKDGTLKPSPEQKAQKEANWRAGHYPLGGRVQTATAAIDPNSTVRK